MELSEDLIWWCAYSPINSKDPIKISCCCGCFFNHLCDGFTFDIDFFLHWGTIEEAFGVWPLAWPGRPSLCMGAFYSSLHLWPSQGLMLTLWPKISREYPLSPQMRLLNQPATEQTKKAQNSRKNLSCSPDASVTPSPNPGSISKEKIIENKIQTWFSSIVKLKISLNAVWDRRPGSTECVFYPNPSALLSCQQHIFKSLISVFFTWI